MLQRPTGSGVESASSSADRKRARGHASWPKRATCGEYTWQSWKAKPQLFSRSVKRANTTFPPWLTWVNMLSPNHARPSAMPYRPAFSSPSTQASAECA
jgi:hypothetical protein